MVGIDVSIVHRSAAEVSSPNFTGSGKSTQQIVSEEYPFRRLIIASDIRIKV